MKELTREALEQMLETGRTKAIVTAEIDGVLTNVHFTLMGTELKVRCEEQQNEGQEDSEA